MPPETPGIPAFAVDRVTAEIAKLGHITLASAIITAAGRPHSVQEALDLITDIQFALHPQPGSGAWQEWKITREASLRIPRS